MTDLSGLDRLDEPSGEGRPILKRAWVWVLVAVLLAAGGWYFLFADLGDASENEAPRRSATIGYRSLGDVVTASGTLKPSRLVEVGAQVSGQLQKLHVKIGYIVAKGDLLAEIDATIQRNQVEASRASLRAQETQLDVQRSSLSVAEAESGRQERLMAEKATTEVEYERAQDALVRARGAMVQLESQIASQRARLTIDEAALGYSTIYAPSDGTVLQMLAAEGQTLTATYVTPVILHLADLSTLTVEAKVAEANIGKLEPGMGVHFTTLGSRGRRWHGTLDQILPRAQTDGNVVTYTALFDVDNADGVLRADMTVQVFFELTAPREILAVPLEMLTDFGERDPETGTPAQVRVQFPDGSIEVREITIGETSHTYAEVLSGLAEGDRVVAPE
ncbi:MAG: efflux RND transporter periplasmic adaptor subunit [Gammaproteobacteria bacterium]|nr:efflux RND transporter periplasmic adaptor subunit [Gammaproteobacteria bacterium]MDE0225370.1 efflux RND transporter periplasmic adaptor subunit [Gammaproteobacteria bacterium]MDE0450302.1 efflux RND transporter periplasmic adaptor subunit [Gammaproteobacteria bacterium]